MPNLLIPYMRISICGIRIFEKNGQSSLYTLFALV